VAAGTLWRLRRPNGPANLRLKRGYAASNSKTDIELSIFPNPCAPAFPKTHCASILRMRDRLPTWLSNGQHDFTRARTKLIFHAEGPADTKLVPPAARNNLQPGECHVAYLRVLPRFAKTSPRASAVQRSRLANLSASLRSGPGGIWRASSKASAAR